MDDLVAFLNARLDEDERWALAASQPYTYAVGSPVAPPGGVHWRWGIGENWTPVEPEFRNGIIGDYGQNSQLLTVETWPTQSVGELPRSYTDHIMEMDNAAAGHIARHDPARVLREVAVKRCIVERHKDCGTGYGYCDDGGHGHDGVGCAELLDLAAIDSDHPDCRSEWKP